MYKITCEDGRCYAIYSSSELAYLDGHLPGKWYFLPYPIRTPVVGRIAFDTPEQAERAARATSRRDLRSTAL